MRTTRVLAHSASVLLAALLTACGSSDGAGKASATGDRTEGARGAVASCDAMPPDPDMAAASDHVGAPPVVIAAGAPHHRDRDPWLDRRDGPRHHRPVAHLVTRPPMAVRVDREASPPDDPAESARLALGVDRPVSASLGGSLEC